MRKMLFSIVLVVLALVSLTANGQTTEPNCGNYKYDSFSAGCYVYVWLPWIPANAQGNYTTHIELPNLNGKHAFTVADVKFYYTASDGTVQTGPVIGSMNGGGTFSFNVGNLKSVQVGNKATLDIYKTSCYTADNSPCLNPPNEVNYSVRFMYVVDPANLTDLDTLSMPFAAITDKVGNVTWRYGYPGFARPSFVLTAQAVLGGGSSCAVGVQNLSARDNYIVVILMDGDNNPLETSDIWSEPLN